MDLIALAENYLVHIMMSKKKNLWNLCFLIVIFAMTLFSVFHGQDLVQMAQYIRNADIRYWLLAVVCVIFFIKSESVIIYYMMHNIGRKVKLLHCFLYSYVGFFFSCITPSATGGQPAQIYYMSKDRIPIPTATLVLMIVTITYKLVLVVIGVIVMLFRPATLMRLLGPVIGWCYLGTMLNVVCVGFMMLLVFHPTMARKILLILIDGLEKIHLMKRTNVYRKKIETAMIQYQDVALYFRTHTLVVWNVFLITVIQRLLLFFVTYLVYRSFSMDEMSIIDIVILQGMISVAVDMLPLPGGMGISEQLFLAIFTPVFANLTLPAMVVSRGLSYYTELLISACLTIVAQLTIGRQKGESK